MSMWAVSQLLFLVVGSFWLSSHPTEIDDGGLSLNGIVMIHVTNKQRLLSGIISKYYYFISDAICPQEAFLYVGSSLRLHFMAFYKNLTQILVLVVHFVLLTFCKLTFLTSFFSSKKWEKATMISIFNIPPESPINYRSSPCQRRFSFPITPMEGAFVATFAGSAADGHRGGNCARYLKDGRRLLTDGKPAQPLSSPKSWEQLIHSELLLNRARLELDSGGTMTAAGSCPEMAEMASSRQCLSCRKIESALSHFLELLTRRRRHWLKRRHSATFYIETSAADGADEEPNGENATAEALKTNELLSDAHEQFLTSPCC